MARLAADWKVRVRSGTGAEKISPPARILRVAPPPAVRLSTPRLMGDIARKTRLLAEKEAALARAEIREDVIEQLNAAKWLLGAALLALFGVGMLLVAAVFALSIILPGWLAALLIALLLLGAAGLAVRTGWSRRARAVLARTRRTIRDAVAAARRIL